MSHAHILRRSALIAFRVLVTVFALVGLTFTGVFVAMRFDLLNVRGTIEERNKFFLEAWKESAVQDSKQPVEPTPSATTSPVTVAPITTTLPSATCIDPADTVCAWLDTPEWAVLESALIKDDPALTRVAQETGVSKRMLAAVVVPEQARFFTSNREVFKRWFEPMKLLGSLTQFSLGVSGIKQETAERIETYANDPLSPFYPGDGMADLLAYPQGTDPKSELFKRLTDEKDHYYSYLYTALFIREVTEQWRKAGYDIREEPEVIVTLFNLGFDKSLPHPAPAAGGAPVTIGNTTYSYGTLGGLFYRSDELIEILPR
ncbi:MAG: hypothetical protein KBD21_04875 [Candidatus Pacebacteria bacterium]|nr:hypothetical protein [Candidatus Paceibacterota bacterium]